MGNTTSKYETISYLVFPLQGGRLFSYKLIISDLSKKTLMMWVTQGVFFWKRFTMVSCKNLLPFLHTAMHMLLSITFDWGILNLSELCWTLHAGSRGAIKRLGKSLIPCTLIYGVCLADEEGFHGWDCIWS